MTTENPSFQPALGSREAFEAALKTRPEARLWNTTDAMFWAFQKGAEQAPAVGAEAVAWMHPTSDDCVSVDPHAYVNPRPLGFLK